MWLLVLQNNGVFRIYGILRPLVQSTYFVDQETEADREGTCSELLRSVTDDSGTYDECVASLAFSFQI